MPAPPESVRRRQVSEAFREHERYLWAVAYRLTGSAADSDDLVQETFVCALERPPADLERSLRPWLVTVLMNRGRDLLRKRRRRGYRGTWLPSPVSIDDLDVFPAYEKFADETSESTEGRYDLIESVSMAFLVALEALTPQQRAVLLLRDVLDYSVRETAAALDIGESNVKTTHHRARRAMSAYDAERNVDHARKRETTQRALESFLTALAARDVKALESVLAEDVVEMSDGGGEFVAALNPIFGCDRVCRFFLGIAPEDPSTFDVDIQCLNGLPAFTIRQRARSSRNAPKFVVAVDVNSAGRIRRLFNVLATPKLSHVDFGD